MKIKFAIVAALSCYSFTYAQTNTAFQENFEGRNISEWQKKSTQIAVTNKEVQKGNFALEVKSGGKAILPVTLKADSRYKLKAWLKTAVGAEEIQLNLDGLKHNNVSVATALTNWTQKELVFQTGNKQTEAILEVYHPISSVGNSAWVDEISIEYLGEAIVEKLGGIKPLSERTEKEDQGITQQPLDKMQWMLDAKFGMFIHWGLYAGPAQGEWYMRNKAIPINEYRKYAYPESGDKQFLADQFNPTEWVQLAKDAGMKYMNLTAQHHDGYALFHSKFPDSFNSYQTHNRDLVREYVDACRAGGLKVGIYKTLINWRYPGYYDIYGNSCKKNAWNYTTQDWHKENARLMKEELYCMTKELLSNYGKIDQIFWDGAWLGEQDSDADAAFFWESGKYLDLNNEWPIDACYTLTDSATQKPMGIMGMVRQLQPDILVNPRCGWRGDYSCEEGGAKISGPTRSSEIYEKTLSLHYAWGYTPLADNPEKIVNTDRIIRYLTDCLIRNMCLLVNVGPDRHGSIPKTEADALRGVGKWINSVQEAVYGTRGGPWNPVDEQYGFTYKENKIYIYLLEEYIGNEFVLPSVDKKKIKKVYDVRTKKNLNFKQDNKKRETKIWGIDRKSSPIVTVLAVELDSNVY